MVVDLAVCRDKLHFFWCELTSTVLISTVIFTVVIVVIVLRITEITLYDACLVNSFRGLKVLRDGRFSFVESLIWLGRSVRFSMHYMAVWLTERKYWLRLVTIYLTYLSIDHSAKYNYYPLSSSTKRSVFDASSYIALSEVWNWSLPL